MRPAKVIVAYKTKEQRESFRYMLELLTYGTKIKTNNESCFVTELIEIRFVSLSSDYGFTGLAADEIFMLEDYEKLFNQLSQIRYCILAGHHLHEQPVKLTKNIPDALFD
jgi:hypothetical protein